MEREMRKKGEVGRGKETSRSIAERKGKSGNCSWYAVCSSFQIDKNCIFRAGILRFHLGNPLPRRDEASDVCARSERKKNASIPPFLLIESARPLVGSESCYPNGM